MNKEAECLIYDAETSKSLNFIKFFFKMNDLTNRLITNSFI